MKNGSFVYETSNSYPFGNIIWVFGDGTVRTKTVATVSEKNGKLFIQGEIDYSYIDEFTDPVNIRQWTYPGTSSSKASPKEWVEITDLGGTKYDLVMNWRTKIDGEI